MKLDLISTIRDLCINGNLTPLIKFGRSIKSTEIKDILQWTICQIITKSILISMETIKSYGMKGASTFEFEGKILGN